MCFFKSVCLLCTIVLFDVVGMEIPNCEPGHYYEPSTLECHACPSNVSMITSSDGFDCICDQYSVPSGTARCRRCNATAMISSDGSACVSRKCQNIAGKIVCRKCPNDNISVTQNFDGSPMKEVLCVKCARGYKAQGNRCQRCESCVCARNEIVVRGKCIPKKYVTQRPKYEENRLHPFALLEIVKNEYLCTQNDLRACRTLASECVRNFYNSDLAGPCRLWTQHNVSRPTYKGLPQITIETKSNEKDPREITLAHGKNTLRLAVAEYTSSGSLKILEDSSDKLLPCLLPLKITIGDDFSCDCHINISKLIKLDASGTFAVYLFEDGILRSLPISLRKPNGYYVQKGAWSTNKFRRYFLLDSSLSITANVTNTIYLRTFLVKLRIQRDRSKTGSLDVRIFLEAHYATTSVHSDVITMSLKVEHEMPNAGVLRGFEIWGGVLGVLLSVYAIFQWRGAVRRGGLYVSLLPILAGSVADTLYFSALFSTIHALAAEAGTLGLTLPLSQTEEYMIKAFIFSAVSLKILKITWLNWNQCGRDIFFLDWSEYNHSLEEKLLVNFNDWRFNAVAKEWIAMQTKRRAPPAFTVSLALFILHLMTSWQSYLPQSQGYNWAIASIAWWTAYVVVLLSRWILDRFFSSPSAALSKVCSSVGLSLLVFQEEYYAHYVHGRNDESPDARSIAGPLSVCRVVCAPQLRIVYKQLSTAGLGLGDNSARQALLSRFLAAFFERALDGLSWVASERTTLERLLDVELTLREGGNTSTLLYDSDKTPSCFNLTWWNEEWSLVTFDALLFGCVLIATSDSLLAALITLTIWQILKYTRIWLGNRNLREKINVEIFFY